MEYNFREIEKKWQQKWVDNKTYKVVEDESKKKFYVLNMFPYPSGAGLHVGHPLGYIASDIYARYKRLQGYNVLNPMGYDAYGLPAEQYAIQTGQHPAITTVNNINRYRQQLDKIGFSFDWDREVRTCEPGYYHWTQWAFQKMFNSYYCNTCGKAEPISELIKHFEEKGTEGLDVACSEELSFTAEEWKAKSEKEQQEVLMNYRQTHRLCLAPGDSLYIELDARVWNDTIRDGTVPESVITFAGNERAAALNRDMADLQQYYQPLRLKYTGENSMEQAIRKYSPEEFETFADSKEREYRDVWNRFRKEHRPVKELNAWVEDMLRYGTWQAKLTYANICQVIKQQNPEAQAPELPKNFIRFVKSYDPDDNRIVTMEHAAFLDMYNQYLLESIYREMDDNPAIKSDDDALQFLQKRLGEKTSGFTEELIRCRFYLEMLPNAPTDILNRYIAPEQFANAYMREKMQAANDELNAVLNGEPAEGTQLIEPDSTIRGNLFESIVADHAGKVVYVDFWAPWCGPCMAEMPFSLELQQHYQNKNVVFVFLCGQCPNDQWRRTVLAEKLTGIHYKPTSEQINELYTQFGIEGIPHYMLVDRNGKIVSHNAPRPSEKDRIVEEIDKLL